MANTHLAIYLNDHLAGSTAALQLLQHLHSAYQAPRLQGFFADLYADVAADRQALETFMAQLPIAESLPRKAAGWLTEQAAQLKLKMDDPAEGDLRLLESLDALALGIEGKQALWCALAAAA